MKKGQYCILGFFLIYTVQVNATGNWNLIKDDAGIKIYTKSEPKTDLIEIKAISTTQSTLEAFVALMTDVENFQEWMYAAEESSLIKKNNDFHFSYYLLSDMPWPANDRDVVLDFRIQRNPETNVIYTQSRNMKGIIPEKKNIHRIDAVESSWQFMSMGNNKVKIIFKTRIKPSICLPGWLADKVYNLGPYHTIKNMKQYIQQDKYQKSTINLSNILTNKK
jgi:hypothetical protein